MNHLLQVNPKVRIYVPAELFGAFGSTLPKGFYKTADALPQSMRYFDGEEPRAFSSGSPWPEGNFVPVESTVEVAPDIFLIPTISNVKETLELRELTLAIDTPLGRVLVVGCSHPGVEEILSAASRANSHVHMLLGGLHLVKRLPTPRSSVSPTHCMISGQSLSKIRVSFKTDHP